MAKTLKTWTTLGFALLSTSQITESAPLGRMDALSNQALILADGEGEGGEGGEGGGGTISSYKLESTDPNAYNYDGHQQIEAYADHVHASYAAARADAEKLSAAIEKMLSEPSEASLASARKAWVAARPAYLQTETFRFYDGPVEAIEGEINAWPLNEAFIDYVEGKPDAGVINGKGTAIDSALLTTMNQKTDEADVTTGWHAIEFLLWGQDLSLAGPGHRPHTDYVDGQGNNSRRRAYLMAVTEKLVTDLQTLENAWAKGDAKNYRTTFVALDQREALGRIINGMAILAGFEFMSERLGVALDSGDQEDEHSCFSDTTKQDFVQDLEGIRRVWNNTRFNELLAVRDPALAKKMADLLLDTETKIARLGDPWDKVLAADKSSPERKSAEDVVASLQALADGFKAVGTRLGLLVLIPTG